MAHVCHHVEGEEVLAVLTLTVLVLELGVAYHPKQVLHLYRKVVSSSAIQW